MTYALTWLPEVLISAGLKVAPVPGWETRGRSEMGEVLGVMCHHTGTAVPGNMPTLGTLVDGRSDLPGPLAQLGLGRDGTFYVIAAGRCNHAGLGNWQGLTGGNTNFIGVEAENSGAVTEPWPAVQLDAYRRGVAAILIHVGRSALFCVGHKEYALPRGRKQDPSFDMVAFRTAVAQAMLPDAAPPALIPPIEPRISAGGTVTDAAPRLTLRRGDRSALVSLVQAKCAVPPDGVYGAVTEAAVREFQRQHGLVPDGIVGPKTWLALDTVRQST